MRGSVINRRYLLAPGGAPLRDADGRPRPDTRNPLWYVTFRDPGGRWRKVAAGVPTKAAARRVLDEVLLAIATGRPHAFDPPAPAPAPPLTFAAAAQAWAASLINRSAGEDRRLLRGHVLPHFGAKPLAAIGLPDLMAYIDAKRAEKRLADPSIRHCLNLISRLFAWAVARGHVPHNPVRDIPTGRRPTGAPKLDLPWIEDDAAVRRLFAALDSPFDLMFAVGITAGLRTGEICGLRLADVNEAAGHFRVRFSYDGPLKEAKPGKPKIKFAPLTPDTAALLAPWIAGRRGAGAGPEDLVFPSRRTGRCYDHVAVNRAFRRAVRAAELPAALTWYTSTRHSFASRSLARGATLDETSAALGHAQTTTTRRYYDHFIRRTFTGALAAGAGLAPKTGEGGAEVVALRPGAGSARELGPPVGQNAAAGGGAGEKSL